MDRRRKNVQWNVADVDGSITWERAGIAVLMDIRDELQRLNTLLHCHNFTQIPQVLRGIRRELDGSAAKARRAYRRRRRKKHG